MPEERMTAKSEKFTLNLFEGMTQRQAYKDAYNPGYADEYVDIKACRLAATAKVGLRLTELREPVTDAVQARKVKKQEKLASIYLTEINPKSIAPRDVLSAIDIDNKLDNLYKPETQVLTDIKIILVRRDPK